MKLSADRLRVRDEKGGVAVEFGVMFPILVLLISGLVTFALAFNMRLTLTQAAREGVRIYALIPDGDWVGATEGAATNMHPDDLTITSSDDCDPSSPGSPPPQSWVNVARDFTLDFAFVPPQTVTLQGRAYMRCGG